MQRRPLLLLPFSASIVMSLPQDALALGETDAASGVRAALERGALAAVSQLGRNDGFFGNLQLKIELPNSLQKAAKLLRATGQGRRLDELVLAMNRAAEQAVPAGREMLVQTVKSLSVEDALQLVKGSGDDAVTRFFEGKTRAPLSERFLPIVTRATEKQKLAEKYNAVAGKAMGLGLVKDEDASLQAYVTRKALDGLYWMIGEEEKKIRQNPVATGSAILKKVFGL